jgi:hypothetical protein
MVAAVNVSELLVCDGVGVTREERAFTKSIARMVAFGSGNEASGSFQALRAEARALMLTDTQFSRCLERQAQKAQAALQRAERELLPHEVERLVCSDLSGVMGVPGEVSAAAIDELIDTGIEEVQAVGLGR